MTAKPYLVGERGPELVIMDVPGLIQRYVPQQLGGPAESVRGMRFVGPKDCCDSPDPQEHRRWCRHWGKP